MGNKRDNFICNKTKSLVCAFFSGLLLLNTLSSAWAVETPEKIFITADYMKMNIETGNSTYTGHVKITQGKLILTGETVTLEQDKEELERLIVTGKPARYNHLTETGETIEAESEHMVYTASKNTLVMTTNAHLKQPDHQLSSQKIVYDTEKKIVIAGGNNQSPGNANQRVNITLTPKESEK
jgi:lipopolysaccharide export system protein LptA